MKRILITLLAIAIATMLVVPAIASAGSGGWYCWDQWISGHWVWYYGHWVWIAGHWHEFCSV